MLITINKSRLVAKLGLEKLTPSQLEKVWPLITNIYQTKLLDNLLSELSEEDKQKLLKFISLNELDKAKKFLNTKITNYPTVLSNIREKIEEEIRQDVLSVK